MYSDIYLKCFTDILSNILSGILSYMCIWQSAFYMTYIVIQLTHRLLTGMLPDIYPGSLFVERMCELMFGF